jgi:tetratricopeptide (TPR) repeat protein
MVMSKEQMLQEAVQAGQSGDLARARELLLTLLRQDNREPLYWLLMSTAVESRDERIYCLQNVLFLDPENSAAKHDLELLGAEVPEEGAPALLPEENEDWQTTEIAAPKIRKRKPRPKEEPWSLSWILGSLGVGLVIIFLGYYAAERGMLDGLTGNLTPLPPSHDSTAPLATALATNTPAFQPTATRQIVIAPRDPSELLAATYTPTPRYISTPHADNAVFQQGLDAYDAGNWAAATGFFQVFLSTNPGSADAAYYLGDAQLQAGDLEAALSAFDQALSIDPQFAPAYLGRARAQIAQEAASSSILTDLNSAVLLDPDLIDAYLERAAYNLGRGNPVSALEDVTAAESKAPQNAVVQYQKALVYLAQSDFESALQASSRAYDLDLTLLPNYVAKARALQGLEEYAQSIETLQSYLSFEGDDGTAWQVLGMDYQLNGQEELALESFERALSLDPNLPQAAYYRGLHELAANENQKALGDFRVAVAGTPDWFEARIFLAQAYLKTGNPSGAFFEINAGSGLAKSDEQRAMLFYWRATALEALNEHSNAIADWQSLLNLPAAAMPAEWRTTAQQHLQ